MILKVGSLECWRVHCKSGRRGIWGEYGDSPKQRSDCLSGSIKILSRSNAKLSFEVVCPPRRATRTCESEYRNFRRLLLIFASEVAREVGGLCSFALKYRSISSSKRGRPHANLIRICWSGVLPGNKWVIT